MCSNQGEASLIHKKEKERIHHHLLTSLATDYLHPSIGGGISYEKFKGNIRSYLSTPRQYELDDMMKFFDELQRTDQLSVGKYDVLRDLTESIDVSIIELIDEAEMKIKKVDESAKLDQEEQNSIARTQQEENGSQQKRAVEPTEGHVTKRRRLVRQKGSLELENDQIPGREVDRPNPDHNWVSYSMSSDLTAEQEHLATLYEDATHCIPVLLEDKEGLPVSEIYAPLLIEEDLDAKKKTRRSDEPSGRRALKSIRDLFYNNEKLARRIFINGEAGSGKSVFCLKLVDTWSKQKQSTRCVHVCEKQSELLGQLEKDGNLPPLLHVPENTCTTCTMERCLSEFDLLYYVPLRDASEGKTSVVDLICDAVCSGCQDLMDRTKKLLSNQNVRSLVILDGLDEWFPPAGFTGLPHTHGVNVKCVLLSTMRPWKYALLLLKPKPDDQIVTLCGLSTLSVAKLIENVLVKFYGLTGEKLSSKFLEYYAKVRDKRMEGLMRMPMMLIAACHLWYGENASLSSLDLTQSFSRTHLYLSLLEQMIKTAAIKQTEHPNTKENAVVRLLNEKGKNVQILNGLPKRLRKHHHLSLFMDTLLPFCELAYTDLVSNETKPVFQKDELEKQLGESQVFLARKLGLISQAKVRGNSTHHNVSVSFYHKSVQELLAAMYLTCGTVDKVQSFCEYCTTLEKVMESANLVMFVMGLEPSIGCRLIEPVTSVVTSDADVQQYRQSFHYWHLEKVRLLYRAQCQWYRELRHSMTQTCDASSLPNIHVRDIYLDADSDSETVKITGELMSSNLESILSVTIRDVRHPLQGVSQLLPQCPYLSKLNLTPMSNDEDNDKLVDAIPHLCGLDTIWYKGVHDRVQSQNVKVNVAIAERLHKMTKLERIEFWNVSLGDDELMVVLTGDMTRLQTVVLHAVDMAAGSWNRLITSLLTIRHTVHVVLRVTTIDDETLDMIRTHFTLIQDDGIRLEGRYSWFEFTTMPLPGK